MKAVFPILLGLALMALSLEAAATGLGAGLDFEVGPGLEDGPTRLDVHDDNVDAGMESLDRAQASVAFLLLIHD
jgi:hypothetical protein